MALKEYKPGTTFPGRMGRTIGESEPAWPSPVAPKRARRTCSSSSSTTPASASLAATARRSARRTSTSSPRMASCSTTCTRRRSARRRAHASSPAAIITRTPCPASPRDRPAIPGGNGAIPFENGFLSEMLLQQGYATYAIGKWHLTPSEQISAAGPYDRWPLGRGFERYYGFLGGDTHQYYPDSSTTIIRSSRRRRRKRATTSPPIWPTRRSTSSPT